MCEESPTFNEKLVISATNYIRKRLNINEYLWVVISSGKMFQFDKHSGMYVKEFAIIRYNKDWLKKANEEQIIKCAFHEVFHAFQDEEVFRETLGIKSQYFRDKEIRQLKIELNPRNNKTKNFKIWHKLLVEQQAEAFAYEMYKIYKKTFSSAKDLIKDYYDMFPNLE